MRDIFVLCLCLENSLLRNKKCEKNKNKSIFYFPALQLTSRSIRKFLVLKPENSVSSKIRKFFRVGFFIFRLRKVPS